MTKQGHVKWLASLVLRPSSRDGEKRRAARIVILFETRSLFIPAFFEYVSRRGTVDGRLRNARLGFNRLTSRRNVCRYERSNGVVARLGTHRRIAGTEITQGTRLINSVVQRNIIRASTRINPRV